MRKLAVLVAAVLGLVMFASAASALPASEPTYANGPLGGVPMIVQHGQTLTVDGAGYAAGSAVTVGIYDHKGLNLTVLGTATADPSGAFTLTTAPIPAALTYRGKQSDICADGTDPSGGDWLLRTSVTVF